MAIGRVAGPLLYSDLDRQGVDLQFSTDNQPLLYLDFANFRAAINSDTLNTTATFTVNGNVQLHNIRIDNTTISSESDITLDATGNVYLGSISSVKVDGGNPNYIMSTDGSGNLSWQNLNELADELDLTAKNVLLGATTDASVVDESAYRYWTPDTTIADAVDNLNQVMLNVYKGTYVGQAKFTANISAGPSPLTVSFTSETVGNPTSFLWEFGDGTTSTDPNPVHTYSNTLGGKYSVYFKAGNTDGTKSAVGRLGDGALAQGSYADILQKDFITLYTPLPIPAFSLSSLSIDSGSAVQLTNQSSYGSRYVVYWGDGTNSVIESDFVPGGISSTPISHTYVNTNGDAEYDIVLAAHSDTAGPTGVTIPSSPTAIRVYSEHTPTFSITSSTDGNNQHRTTPYGFNAAFSNTTVTNPGNTSTFPGNVIKWVWGDGTSTLVNIGSTNAGDVNSAIIHPFLLSDPTVEQVFTVTLEIYNGHSTHIFSSATQQITVHPAPTAAFTGVASTISDRVGDNDRTGYLFTDLLLRNRSETSFVNTSINADTYSWSLGDGTVLGSIVSPDSGSPASQLLHTYNNAGVFSVSLLSHGASSINETDDTLLRSNYVSILPPPPPPALMGSQTMSIASTGTLPLLAANATKNTTAQLPAAGTPITRITTLTPVETSTVESVYNDISGAVSAIVNGSAESALQLTGSSNTGVFDSLVVTRDNDAHSKWPDVYPSEFYKIFSGKISQPGPAVAVGVNSYQLSHSTTGNTPVLFFAKDDVVLPPSIDISSVIASTADAGELAYVSGIPYFNKNGKISFSNISVFNWIGQTYCGVSSPLTIVANAASEGAGTIISTQAKTYADLDSTTATYLVNGIPAANTGKSSLTPYAVAPVTVDIDRDVAATSTVSIKLQNVNGVSNVVSIPTKINVLSVPVTGIDEMNIPVSVNLGSGFSDNGKRILIDSANGATPTINSNLGYYTNSLFIGSVDISESDEAVVRYGALTHSVIDYSKHLPSGPNCSNRQGLQYFRFAFRRTTVANFTVTYSGKISGIMIAAPGTQIDDTSSLNKWLDATAVYAGAGIPGENVSSGGNGSNGCAKTAGDIVVTGQQVTSKTCTLTLGSANSSNSFGYEILVSVALNAGDSLTAISIS